MKSYIIKYLKTMYLFQRRKKYLKKNKVNIKLWKQKFINLLESGDLRYDELLKEFMFAEMKKISNNQIKRKNKYSPILFCVIKNDINKIQNFMKHYRKLGIECFIFLDNNSTDGTREYLCNQKDVIVFFSSQEYSSARRVAWLNRLLAIYGCNKWCLIVDSDELITYIDYEKYLLSDIVKKAIKNKYYRIEGFMLDMYSSKSLFYVSEEKDYVDEYKYFDVDTYRLRATDKGVVIFGGPRKRVFNREMQLSKYPLFYYRDQDFVASSHYIIPFESIKKCPIWLAICHYKFMGKNDLTKIQEAIKKENYAGGSIDYKTYFSVIKSKENLSFYEEGKSYKMEDSNSLYKISFLNKIF